MVNISPVDTPRGRAGNAISCATCGKQLCPKRGSRRMRFCGVACRQSAFRAKKWTSRLRSFVAPHPRSPKLLFQGLDLAGVFRTDRSVRPGHHRVTRRVST
jgi:hypothetical protein